MMHGMSRRAQRMAGTIALLGGMGWLTATTLLPPAHGAGGDGFVRWTEPKEKAYTQDVPQGWKIIGGLVRAGKTDTRSFIQAESPQKDAVVQIGDPALPQFCTLGPLDRQLGYHEGQERNVLGNFIEVYSPFLSGTEFNRWYIQNRLSQAVKNVQVGKEQNLQQLSETMTASAVRQAGTSGRRPVVSVGVTEFSGISQETGKPVKGAVMTMTQLINADSGQSGSIWTALPVVVGGVEDENAGPRSKKVIDIASRMMQSRRENPAWAKKETARVARTAQESIARNKRETQVAIARIRDAGARSRAIARSSDSIRQSSMNAYWQRRAAQDESHHQFINYLRDEHDETHQDGTRETVPNGY